MAKFTLKYGKKKHKNVELNDGDTFDDLQATIFSLIQVPPSRQKIIVKGKLIENSNDLTKIKNKSTVIVTGSVEQQTIKTDVKVKYIEDMNLFEQQQAMAILPPGLNNLGNTCYLNSCLQCLKGIPELKTILKGESFKNEETLASNLGELFGNMDRSTDAVTPQKFVSYFRSHFPQFASRNEHNMWEQQDADECLTTIFNSLRRELKVPNTDENKDNSNNNNNTNYIDEIFEGKYETETKCGESSEEKVEYSSETFLKLRCFIDKDTRHISDGINKSLTENIEKRSNILGRNAVWNKKRSISKLPQYITVQLVRFFWKQDKKKNAKIVRRIIFPDKLDVYPFCNKTLKLNIEEYRRLKLEREDKKREQAQKVTINDDSNASKKPANNSNNNNNNNANDTSNTNNDNANNEVSTEAKANDSNAMDVDTDVKIDVNKTYESGYYELCGIVTHKGRSANSGHYIGYSKDLKRGKWLKYDDDDVYEVKDDDIKSLYGGGDWQMGFLCFYRKIEPQKFT